MKYTATFFLKPVFVLLLLVLTEKIPANSFTVDSLLMELKKPVSDSSRVILIINYIEQNHLSNDSEKLFILKALDYAEQVKSPYLISKSLHYLSHWHIGNTKNQDTILFYCRTHLERMQQLKYIPGVACAYSNLGMAYTWNSLDSSLYYNLKCIELYKSVKEFDRANNAKLNLGNVYLEMKRYAEAIAIFKETANYARLKGNRNVASLSYFNMSECYTRLGDLKNIEKSINEGCAFNDTTVFARAYCNAMLADVFVLENRLAEAEALYKLILKLGIENDLEYILYRGNYGMADVSFKKGKWEDAIMFKKRSWDYSYKDLANRQSLYKMIYACDSALGNYQTALASYQQYVAVRDCYESAERLKHADALEAKYKNKEKQAQIELLDKERLLQNAEIEKQQLMRNLIIVLVLVLMGGSVLLFNRFKLKKKIEQQTALLTERKRISAELHDDLGAQLSTARMFLNTLKNNAYGNDNKKIVETSLGLIDSSIKDLRKIMDDLQASTLQEKGYLAATEELVNKINQLQQIKFYLTHHGMEKRVDHKTEHHLFRITQELLNNTLKYAEAKTVTVDLVNHGNKLVLMYEDDGKGFDLIAVNNGFGIANINSRAQSMGGVAEFDSIPGKGTRVIIEMPLNNI